MGRKDLKHNRTTQYLTGTSARNGFDGFVEFGAIPPSPPGRYFVPRLTLSHSLKVPYKAEDVCETISSIASEDAMFFCDTSLFDDRTDHRIWDALLDREGKVILVPPVRRELDPWLALHETHVAAQAILGGDPSVRILGIEESDWRARASAEYYITLLGNRKRLVEVEVRQFEEKHGRTPDEPELRTIMEEMHKVLGPRGYMLAKKGAAAESQNLYTDEALVYLAFKTCIETGRDVVILTKDEDIFEQFYKLQWLLDTHYRSMLLADLYVSRPSRFVTHPVPDDCADQKKMFIGDNSVLLERSARLIEGSNAPILPWHFTPAMVQCWVIGEKFASISFCAERGMERLLHTKGITGGLNTYKFGEKNLHLWLAPYRIPEYLRGCAAIALDRRIKSQSGLVEMPLFDTNQAIYTREPFVRASRP